MAAVAGRFELRAVDRSPESFTDRCDHPRWVETGMLVDLEIPGAPGAAG